MLFTAIRIDRYLVPWKATDHLDSNCPTLGIVVASESNGVKFKSSPQLFLSNIFLTWY